MANSIRRSNCTESPRALNSSSRSRSLSLRRPDRSYKVGNTSLGFEHTALKEAGFRLRESSLLVQALKITRGRTHHASHHSTVREKFDPALRQRILRDTRTSTTWVYAAIQEIAKESLNG